MKADVRRFIRRHGLMPAGAPVLVAVSGGVDSVVLLDVLVALGHPCTLVHVDHGLRGAESDADRAFVEEHAASLGLACHVRKVDVRLQPKDGRSVQMVARDLRYAALKAVALELGIGSIALAHHRDDAIETFLIELLRGGMSTIPLRSGPFVRPLLSLGRDAIEAHAREHGLAWREDASNQDPKYLRNRVRHQVLPLLEALSPAVRRVLGRSLERLRAQGEISDSAVHRELQEVTNALPLAQVKQQGQGALLLHHWLRPLGFHPDQLERLLDAVEDMHVGATFNAGEHCVTVDREALLLGPVEVVPLVAFQLDEALALPSGAPFRIERCGISAIDLEQGMAVAWLYADRLQFPLLFRPWQVGDRMRPTGLGGSKLVSDILTEAHVPRSLKDRTWVLCSQGEIVWLVGYRLAEGFAVPSNSQTVLRVELLHH